MFLLPKINATRKMLILLCVSGLILIHPPIYSQCFRDQYDIDFILSTLDRVIVDFLPTWLDHYDEYGNPVPGAWRQVEYQTSPYFSNADNDGNGIYDNDHFDLLGAVLDGHLQYVLGSLNSNDVQKIRSDFAYNKVVVESLQITIRNIKVQYGSLSGTTSITTGDPDVCVKLGGGVLTLCVSQFVEDFEGVPTLWQLLEEQSPLFKNAMVNLIAGYMTIGEDTGIRHLKSLFRVIIYTVLKDVLPTILENVKTDDIVIELDLNGQRVVITIYGSEIDRSIEEFVSNFNCTKFRCNPLLLGASGDLNRDSRTNYSSYVLANMNRQSWMTNESIQNPPLKITQPPQSQSVVSGTEVEFTVNQVGGVNNGVPDWYKWEEIKISDFSTIGSPTYDPKLVIPYALPTPQPRYFTVTICDSYWTRRSPPAKLEVQYIPLEVIQHPQSVANVVPDEDSCSLSVKVRGGNALPAYQWQKWNGTSWSDINSATSNILSFNPVRLEDGGTYRCLVTSGSEQVVSNSADITILNRIRFAYPLPNAGVYVGESYVFSPIVVGEPFGELKYLWKFNGEVIEGETGSTLTIENAQLDDMGYYTCVIYDDQFTIESNQAFFEVAEHMEIIEQPQSGRAILGYDYTFTIVVTGGLGGVHYFWYRDGTPVGPDSPVFLLYPLSEADEGTYWCVVRDAREELVSEQATLQLFPPFNFDIQPQGAMKYTGDSHTFVVQVSGGSPPYSYRWRKNGVNLPYTEPVLTLENLQPSDSGTYVCFVSDQNAGASSAPAVLQVANHMSFIQQPQSAIVYRGSTHTFRVIIDGGLGNLTYKWYKKVGSINLNLGVNSPNLVLHNVQNETAGSYFCVVEDAFETVTSQIAVLTVVEPLTFTKQPTEEYRFVGGDVTFEVQTTGGIGTITYKWYKDGVPLNVTSPTLVLQDVSYSNAGYYWCEATDVVKTTPSASARLYVLRPLPMDGIGVIVLPINGSQMVPPVNTIAYGQAFGLLQPVPNSDNYYLYLSGSHSVVNPTNITINRGFPGSIGPVVFSFTNVNNLGFYSEITNGKAAEIAVGMYYLVICSQNYPNGEIRGQILLNTVQRTLTISVEGNGTTNPPAGAYPFWDREIASVSATPSPGWEFWGWSGDISKGEKANSILLTMDRDRSITAIFVPVIPEGSQEGEGIVEGSVEGEGTAEGVIEGQEEGIPFEGNVEGLVEGIPEGGIEGIVEGTTEGMIEGEGVVEGEGQTTSHHSADTNLDYIISLGELLRVIQFFNAGGYHCASTSELSEDGYIPGYGGNTSCIPHTTDYLPQDWVISLQELLRIIQFFNSGGYRVCEGSEDGFCPRTT
ncbi:MAG: immunoglobulin domain-containing protein [Candidatus Hydrogenedentes bacterium]|nr:immunoglobulin domain-containing protein [Candidatus Hydrogenedentota bacterium]